ncbi:MAG TPA: diguanylate cyclase [Nitrospirota bacterium]|nr:diguanylate cyclase [Nitrospirota bacterium]
MKNNKTFPRLFNTWHFIWLAILFAELFTTASNAIQSVLWYGKISSSLMIIGAIDALVVSLIVAPIIFYFIRHTTELKGINEQLHRQIAERQRAEAELQKSEIKYRTIFENVQDIFYQADANGNIIDISPSITKYTGYSREELIGKPEARFYLNSNDRERMLEIMEKTGEVIDYEVVLKAKDDHQMHASLHAHLLYDKEGNSAGVEGVMRDITERKQAAAQLKQLNEILSRQATTDPLTGIANRLKFKDVLNTEIRRATRFNTSLSLIMLDVDDFKKINDIHGHHVGDDILCELTTLITPHVRIHDLFARWGGEEFMIMVTNTSIDNARHFAEKLRRIIEKHDFPSIRQVTCSFGVAQLGKDENDIRFTHKVDNALYRAKAKGRNRVEIA